MMKAGRGDLSNSDALLMLEEVTHRVNNELSAAIYVVAGAASRAKTQEVRMELDRLSKCLQGFAGVQRALEVPAVDRVIDAAAYLRKLCTAITVSKLAPRGIELIVTEHALQLRSFQCWVLGAIVSELISNSFAHAFGESGGTILVELYRYSSIVKCRVEDNGKSCTAPTPGRGHRIISSLAECLGGTITHAFGDRGSRCTLTFSACSGG